MSRKEELQSIQDRQKVIMEDFCKTRQKKTDVDEYRKKSDELDRVLGALLMKKETK